MTSSPSDSPVVMTAVDGVGAEEHFLGTIGAR